MESVGRWVPTRPSGGRCRWAGRERIRAIGSAGRSIVPCRVRGAFDAGRKGAPSRASMSAREWKDAGGPGSTWRPSSWSASGREKRRTGPLTERQGPGQKDVRARR